MLCCICSMHMHHILSSHVIGTILKLLKVFGERNVLHTEISIPVSSTWVSGKSIPFN